MKSKKLIALMLAAVMVFACVFTGCGASGSPKNAAKEFIEAVVQGDADGMYKVTVNLCYIDGEEIYTIFEDTEYGDIELIVPDESVNAYRTTLGWHYFTKITPLSTTAIDKVTAVEEEDEADAVYYDILGRVAKNPQKGHIYIKKTATKATKVVF